MWLSNCEQQTDNIFYNFCVVYFIDKIFLYFVSENCLNFFFSLSFSPLSLLPPLYTDIHTRSRARVYCYVLNLKHLCARYINIVIIISLDIFIRYVLIIFTFFLNTLLFKLFLNIGMRVICNTFLTVNKSGRTFRGKYH